MTVRPVIDAGPALGFFAINKERLLISVLGRLSAPETVAAERRRLERFRAQGKSVGGLRLVNTLTVLERAAGGEHLPDRAAMRTVYTRLRAGDDGLPPIENTRLLLPGTWGNAPDRAGTGSCI